MDLCFNIVNQVLQRTDSEKAVNKSNNYLTLNFSFSEDWDDLEKFLLLRTPTPALVRYSLGDDDKVTLGGSVLTGDYFTITLYGVDGDGTRITTNQVRVVLRDSGYVACTPEEQEAVDILTEMYDAIMGLETVDLDVEYLDGSTGSFKVLIK